MAQPSQNQMSVLVDSNKATYIQDIAKLSVEALAILAEKSKKPGIELRLKIYQKMI